VFHRGDTDKPRVKTDGDRNLSCFFNTLLAFQDDLSLEKIILKSLIFCQIKPYYQLIINKKRQPKLPFFLNNG
jgi:hypothetical protein